ncbi:MAG: TetR/AcrR family transcriptional regulator [Caulobacteraceae bacterium]
MTVNADAEVRPQSAPRRTQRFRDRQAEIVRAAVGLINRKGVRGMTLAEVAAKLGIVPTGVIYYFKSKEDLAAACFLSAIEAYQGCIASAMEAPSSRGRLHRFIEGYIDRAEAVAAGRCDRVAVFNDVRALNDPRVNAAYTEMFLNARALLSSPPPRGPMRRALNAATHLVLSQLFWSVVWLPLYDPSDYRRAGTRMLDVLENGLAGPGQTWPKIPASFAVSGPAPDVSRETFLRAATEIINEHGYLGASVDRISARLNVTKGSFYHHNEDKDDLVVACFRRTVEVMRRVQRTAIASQARGWDRLASATGALIHGQATGAAPLLRTSALTSAPEAIQSELVAEFDRISVTFSAMISDGIADGSILAVDPHIGAQMVTATINAAAELRHWARGEEPIRAAELYAKALLQGIGAVVPGFALPG